MNLFKNENYISNKKLFLLRKNKIFTFLLLMLDLFLLIISPDFENMRSDATDVAGTMRYFKANSSSLLFFVLVQ
jgi:hypothetical protein